MSETTLDLLPALAVLVALLLSTVAILRITLARSAKHRNLRRRIEGAVKPTF